MAASRLPPFAMLGAAVLLAGCAAGPDFVPPAPPGVTEFVAATDGTTRCPCDTREMPADWWRLLGNPALDALVQRALRASPTLEAARATLAQAEELRRAGGGVFLPQVDASATSAREEATVVSGGKPHAAGPYTLATAAGTVGYSLDVFGGHRRAVEGLAARVDQARAELEGARIALAANVADAVIARAADDAQMASLVDLARLQDEQLRLAQVQYDAGIASGLPVLALQSARSATTASIAALRDRSARAQTLLARLCGAAPSEFAADEIPLESLRLPVQPPLELPAAWARHRPDILDAQAQLRAANAQIGVATAAMLPDLTLTGQAGRASTGWGTLLSAGTPFWSIQATLAATLFDGGSKLHARRAAVAARDAAAAQYRQVVLTGLEQVADTLHALANDGDAWQARASAADSATQAVALAQARWEAGTGSYLDLLANDAQLRNARIDQAAATAQRLQDAVALYVALGGGWWNRDAAPTDIPPQT